MNYSKWKLHRFSTGCDTGEDFLQFEREMRSDLRKQLELYGVRLHKFHKNHYCFSAVAERNGRYVYISLHDVRGCTGQYVSWFENVLYRTMRDDRDWTGGTNRYVPWDRIGAAVGQLLE